jgi:hypothetical protein
MQGVCSRSKGTKNYSGRNMTQSAARLNQANPRRTRCVTVVYETPAIREHAVGFCERLAEESDCIVLETNWWSFELLSHTLIASDAAQKAAAAEVIIFAMNVDGDLPPEIKLWIENWLAKRGEREGALVGLLEQEPGPPEMASFREIYLRHVARRAGMDYLSHGAPTAADAIPDSIDSVNQRAGLVTSVLDDILHTHPHSPPLL